MRLPAVAIVALFACGVVLGQAQWLAHNPYGHPSPEPLERLETAGQLDWKSAASGRVPIHSEVWLPHRPKPPDHEKQREQ